MPLKKARILITGGAGFIGTNLIDSLLKDKKWEIIVLDALIKQVHTSRSWKVPQGVKFISGDVCNKNTVRKSLEGVNYIIHLAAETGVGQSAYEIARYVKTNEYGTAVLLETASKLRHSLKGVIIASSRAVYGEGRYSCLNCGTVYPGLRDITSLKSGRWEPRCPHCSGAVKYLKSIEDQLVNPTSIYGITKCNQEQLLKQFSHNFDIPVIVLRFQNVYGPGQSLHNPYTGILSLFSTRIISDKEIHIYEDGSEQRDFVYIKDVVSSVILSLKKGFTKKYAVYNVGSGKRTKIIDIAGILVRLLTRHVPIRITGKSRIGDIRHACADISCISKDLGFKPQYSTEQGLTAFAKWVKKQPLPKDRFKKTEDELANKNLLVKSIND